MTNEEKFVNELIGYIFAYPDDDYMTMECLCRKLHKHELIAKVNGHWQQLDKRCEECIFVEGSHWCDGCDKTPKGMKEYDEYWAREDHKTEPRKEQNFCGKCRYLYRDFKYGLSCYRLMDNEPCKYEERKTENSSEKPNNCEECKHWNDTEDGCADRHGCRATTEDWQDWKDKMWAEAIVTEPTTEDSSTVPTSSILEQVDEPQTCSVNGRPYTDCCNCEYFKCTADEPQTEEWYTFQDEQEYNARHGKE